MNKAGPPDKVGRACFIQKTREAPEWALPYYKHYLVKADILQAYFWTLMVQPIALVKFGFTSSPFSMAAIALAT